MDHDQSYRSLCKSADFICLVLNRIVIIINDKVAELSAELLGFINESNVIGLKKKHSAWNEIIKNYTVFMTSFNNLIGFSHTMNYCRKNLIKTLMGSKDPKYIRVKVESFSEAAELFLEHLHAILTCLQYFAAMDPSEKYNTEIKNLNDVYRVLTDTKVTIEKKHLPKVRQTAVELLAKYTKTGEFESTPVNGAKHVNLRSIVNRVSEVRIQGGLEETESYKVMLGGIGDPEESVISGYHIDKHLEQHIIQRELLAKVTPEQWKNVSRNVELILEPLRIEPKAILIHMIKTSGALNNIAIQMERLITKDLEQLIKYHCKRSQSSQKYELVVSISKARLRIVDAAFSYVDGFGKIDMQVFWHPDTIQESIESGLQAVEAVFKLIDQADIDRVVSTAKTAFKSRKAEASQYTEADARKRSKDKIRADIRAIRKAYADIDFDLLDKSTIAKIRKLQQQAIESPEPRDALKNIDTIIKIETILVKQAKVFTENIDFIAQKIHEMADKIDTMIDPNNSSTCIKKPALLIEDYIVALLNKDSGRVEQLKKHIPDSRPFYTSAKGLDLDAVRDAAIQLVGQI